MVNFIVTMVVLFICLVIAAIKIISIRNKYYKEANDRRLAFKFGVAVEEVKKIKEKVKNGEVDIFKMHEDVCNKYANLFQVYTNTSKKLDESIDIIRELYKINKDMVSNNVELEGKILLLGEQLKSVKEEIAYLVNQIETLN
jgi:hypothetical protein